MFEMLSCIQQEVVNLLITKLDCSELIFNKNTPYRVHIQVFYLFAIYSTGKDGDPQTVYEVLYKGADTARDVTDLVSDFQKGHVKFIDV